MICDNCGEIVLDKLFTEQLRERFPHLAVKAMVRGAEVLNDATLEDAVYVGLDKEAEMITNGEAVAGTIRDMLPETSRRALDETDIILSKGQGNYEGLSGCGLNVYYESLSGEGFPAYYAFLCKCELFTGRFGVPRLTGIFTEEKTHAVNNEGSNQS